MSGHYDDRSPPTIMTAPRTIALTAEQFFTLTDGCEAALDAGVVGDDLAARLAQVSADLRARGFSRVLPFRKPEAVS